MGLSTALRRHAAFGVRGHVRTLEPGPPSRDRFIKKRRHVAALQIMRSAGRRTTTLPILSKSLERDRRQVFAEFLSFPPRARFSMLVDGCKSVSIESGPDVSRRFLRKRIAREKSRHVRFAFEQTNFEVVEPRVFSRRSQCGEPHLPVEPRLMRRAPAGRSHHIAWFPFEFIR